MLNWLPRYDCANIFHMHPKDLIHVSEVMIILTPFVLIQMDLMHAAEVLFDKLGRYTLKV